MELCLSACKHACYTIYATMYFKAIGLQLVISIQMPNPIWTRYEIMTKNYFCVHQETRWTHISIILTTIFRTKFTSWPIKLNTYMLEIKFVSYKQYLFGRLFSVKAKKSRTDQISLQVFNLSELKRLNSFNSSSYKKSFFLVSMI